MLIIETTTSLSVSIRYNTDLFDHATITRIGSHFETVLRSVVSEIELTLNELKNILVARRFKTTKRDTRRAPYSQPSKT